MTRLAVQIELLNLVSVQICIVDFKADRASPVIVDWFDVKGRRLTADDLGQKIMVTQLL